MFFITLSEQNKELKAENKDFLVLYQKEMRSGKITFFGKVLSKKESPHKPVPYINIEMEGQKVGTVTNKSGEFEFIIPTEKGVLKVYFTGYETLKFIIN